jgi:23S rRNA pseudouridine1911/1915/1917 synthase
MYKKECHIIPRDCPANGLRLDRVVQGMCGLPRAQVVGMFDHGCIHVNGCLSVFPGQKVLTGDKIELTFEVGRGYPSRPPHRRQYGFDLVFEDRYLLVVQKPAGLLTVPTRREESDTLVARVARYVRDTKGDREVFHAHRLDREVSGLLVFGRTEPLAAALRDQFAANKPERLYMALVAGTVAPGEPLGTTGTFSSLLATDSDLNRFSTDDAEIGQRAVTHYRVLRRLPDTTLVQIWLETGRRNQSRVTHCGLSRESRFTPSNSDSPIPSPANCLNSLHPGRRKWIIFWSPWPSLNGATFTFFMVPGIVLHPVRQDRATRVNRPSFPAVRSVRHRLRARYLCHETSFDR